MVIGQVKEAVKLRDRLLTCAVTPVYIVFNHPADLRLMKTPRMPVAMGHKYCCIWD